MRRKRKVSLRDINSVKLITDLDVCRVDERVAYVLSTVNDEEDRREMKLRLIEEGVSRDFSETGHYAQPRWSPDGRSLGFLKKTDDGLQLFIAPLSGGEPRQVTREAVEAYDWSPDSNRIVLVRSVTGRKKTPKEKNAPVVIRNTRFKMDGLGLQGERRRHLFVLDNGTGKERQITRGDWHCSEPTWSPDGRSICFVSNRHRSRWNSNLGYSALWIVSAAGGRAVRITPERGVASAPVYAPQGHRIAYVGAASQPDLLAMEAPQLMVADARGGQVLSLTGRKELQVYGRPSWSGESRVRFTAFTRACSQVFECQVRRGTIRQLSDGEQLMPMVRFCEGRIWYLDSWFNRLPEVVSSQLTDWQPKPETIENSALQKVLRFGRVVRQKVKAPDGMESEGFVLYPPDYRRDRRYPMILNIHGGPISHHPMNPNMLSHQVRAARGYVVLLPNPRGSTSYGNEFMRGCVGDWGGGDYDDIMAGVDRLVQRKVADPKRLHVEGYSYGGFMTSWIVGHTDRFRAAVIGAPLTDLSSAFATSDINDYLGLHVGGNPYEQDDDFRHRSPLTYVKQVKTPVMLAHWEGDIRCPIGQSEQLYMALKALGKEAVFVRYPGGSHGGRTPSQDLDLLTRMLDWHGTH